MLPLRCGKEALAVDGSEQVVVSNVAVGRAGDHVRHTQRRGKSVCGAGVGDGTYCFDGEGPRP